MFVLFTLYYYIASKKEVPHHQLLEEEFEREEDKSLRDESDFQAKYFTKTDVFYTLISGVNYTLNIEYCRNSKIDTPWV